MCILKPFETYTLSRQFSSYVNSQSMLFDVFFRKERSSWVVTCDFWLERKDFTFKAHERFRASQYHVVLQATETPAAPAEAAIANYCCDVERRERKLTQLDTTWHNLTQLDTTTFSVWFEVDVFLVPRVGFSMFLVQYGQSCHRISLECANLVLFGRQRQRRHRRLLLLRHRIDNIWQLLVELWFGAKKYTANLFASTCEARFRMRWCVQGTGR